MKKLLWVIGLCLMLALVAVLYIRSHAKELLLHQLKNKLEKTFGNYYALSFEALDITLSGAHFSISISNPVLSTDTSNYTFTKRYPALFFKASRLYIQEIEIWELLNHGSISLDSVILTDPELSTILLNKKERKQSTLPKDSASLPGLASVHIKGIGIYGGSISVSYSNKPAKTVYHGKKINLRLLGIHIDMRNAHSILETPVYTNLIFEMADMAFFPQNGTHWFGAKTISLNLAEEVLSFTGLNMLPHQSLKKISKAAAYQKTFMKLHLGQVSLSGFKHHEIFNNTLKIRKINVSGASIHLYRNKQKEFDTAQYKKSIQYALQHPGLTLDIDTIHLSRCNLLVEILFPKQTDAATVVLNDISGNIVHLKTHQKKNIVAVAKLRARLMKHARLVFSLHIPMNKHTHTFDAVITHMVLKDWNPVLDKLAPVQIHSGFGSHLHITGNVYGNQCSGNMVFQYDSLTCDVYSDKSGERKRSRSLSFLANEAVHRSNPVKKDLSPTQVFVESTKAHYQAQPVLWIGAVMDGMLKTMLKKPLLHQVEKRKKRSKKPR